MKELRLSFMSSEKCDCEQNISTISRVWERCSVAKLNVQIAWTISQNDPCRRPFQVHPPPPPLSSGFLESLTPAPARISRIPSVGGGEVCGFFQEQLNDVTQ